MGKNFSTVLQKKAKEDLLPPSNSSRGLINIVQVKDNITLIKPSELENPEEILEEFKSIILKGQCSNIILDLTELSFLKSIRVGVLAATYHFVEFITGKVYVIVQDRQAQASIEILNLSNAVIVYNDTKLCLDNIA